MDPVKNPYSPGAGSPPPELAGRDKLREQVRVAIARIRRGNPAKSVLMVGLRGVGKTVLLDRMRLDAEGAGAYTLRIEAPENRSLPAMLAPQLRQVLLRLSRTQSAKKMAQRALRALAGFAKALKVTYHDIEVGLDFDAEPGLADNGDLETDLTALLEEVGLAARNADNGRAALFHRAETLFGSQILFQHVRGVLNLPAAGASQIAAEQRLQHQDERVLFPPFYLLADHIGRDRPHL